MSKNSYIRQKIDEGMNRDSSNIQVFKHDNEMDAWEYLDKELDSKLSKAIEVCKEAFLTQSKICSTRFYFDSTMNCWLSIYCSGSYNEGNPVGFIEGTDGFYDFMKSKGLDLDHNTDYEIDLIEPDAIEILRSLNRLIKQI